MKFTRRARRRRQQDGLTAARIAGVQSAYYVPTAIAPFLSRRGFETITGPKSDWWLVETVGVLVGVVGGVLGVAARRGTGGEEIQLLGAGSALGLAAIDVAYVARGRISRVYLVDAAAQTVLIAGWAIARCEGQIAAA
jgi:hypothetical protein